VHASTNSQYLAIKNGLNVNRNGQRMDRRKTLRPLSGPAGLIGLAMLLAGCHGQGADASLPSASSTATPSPVSDTDAVTSIYTTLVAELDHADSLPADTRRRQLSIHMSDPQLSRVLDRIDQLRAKHLTSYGNSVVHVKSVHVAGDQALLRDCQDSSGAGLENALTHKKVNRGLKEEGIKAYLSKGADGKWRVTKLVSLGKGCR
jgi:hypothetical protein